MRHEFSEISIIRSAFERLIQEVHRKPLDKYSIAIDKKGIHIEARLVSKIKGRQLIWDISWSEISQILIFSTDNYSHDLVWAAIMIEDVDDVIEVPEYASGWQSVFEELPNYLEGVPPQSTWYYKAVYPSYGSYRKIIYQKAPNKKQKSDGLIPSD